MCVHIHTCDTLSHDTYHPDVFYVYNVYRYIIYIHMYIR